MSRRDKSARFKEISIALIIAYIAEHIEDAFTQFLHLYTNTEYPKTDLTPGIISSMIASVGIVGLGDKANPITSSFFATGLIVVIIEVYNNIKNGKEIDYDNIVKSFIYDSSFIAIITYFYDKFLDVLKQKQRKHYCGDVYEVVKGVIENLPIALYFGYRAFEANIKEVIEEKNSKTISNKEYKINK